MEKYSVAQATPPVTKTSDARVHTVMLCPVCRTEAQTKGTGVWWCPVHGTRPWETETTTAGDKERNE